jgi:hypothetical protein
MNLINVFGMFHQFRCAYMYITVTIFGCPIYSLVKIKRWGDYYLLFESFVGISLLEVENVL